VPNSKAKVKFYIDWWGFCVHVTFFQGFNYAYRRSATVSATPASSTSALPEARANTNQQPTKAATPGVDKPLPPHLANKSNATTPPPVNGSSAQTDKESPSPAGPRVNGSSNDKDKTKKKDKNNNKKDKSENNSAPATPEIPSVATARESSPAPVLIQDGLKEQAMDDVRSPVEQGSSGTRTPRTGKAPRHPWTIFMRMASHLQVTDAEIKDFFGDAKNGITRINQPYHHLGKSKLAYIEFGDEEAMKAGLEKHTEVGIFFL
jgi:hypothetical protein